MRNVSTGKGVRFCGKPNSWSPWWPWPKLTQWPFIRELSRFKYQVPHQIIIKTLATDHYVPEWKFWLGFW